MTSKDILNKSEQTDISNEDCSSNSTLIPDIWGNVFQFISFFDLFRTFTFVCKTFKKVIETHPYAISNFSFVDLTQKKNSKKVIQDFHDKNLQTRCNFVKTLALDTYDFPFLKNYTHVSTLSLQAINKGKTQNSSIFKALDNFGDIRIKNLSIGFFTPSESEFFSLDPFGIRRHKEKFSELKSFISFVSISFLHLFQFDLLKLTSLQCVIEENSHNEYSKFAILELKNLISLNLIVIIKEASEQNFSIKKDKILLMNANKNYFPKLKNLIVSFRLFRNKSGMSLLEKRFRNMFNQNSLFMFFQNVNTLESFTIHSDILTGYASDVMIAKYPWKLFFKNLVYKNRNTIKNLHLYFNPQFVQDLVLHELKILKAITITAQFRNKICSYNPQSLIMNNRNNLEELKFVNLQIKQFPGKEMKLWNTKNCKSFKRLKKLVLEFRESIPKMDLKKLENLKTLIISYRDPKQNEWLKKSFIKIINHNVKNISIYLPTAIKGRKNLEIQFDTKSLEFIRIHYKPKNKTQKNQKKNNKINILLRFNAHSLVDGKFPKETKVVFKK